jgi:hypothetical protein
MADACGGRQREYMEVSVSDPRTEDDPPGSGRGRHTTYLVSVRTNLPAYGAPPPQSLAVRRRFNAFAALYEGLGALARTKFTRLPDLPRKTSLVQGAHTAHPVTSHRWLRLALHLSLPCCARPWPRPLGGTHTRGGCAGTDRFAPALVEERRKAFEAILRAAADNAALRRSEPLFRFLTTADPAATAERSASSGAVSDSDP